ncbi:MAG: phenylacetate--CoA ligase [bacterium]|nr:phenylacetate--CoA ligase [bacterium]
MTHHRIWNPESETLPRNRLRALQTERLRSVVRTVHEKVPFYRDLFKRSGLTPHDVRSLDDLRKLPFTTKADLQSGYPYGFFAVPMRDVVRIHSSSGTTGRPTVVGYTRGDLENWSELIARLLTAGGVTSEDVVQIAFGYGLFTGGFGLHYGAERVGAAVIPVSSGNTQRQIMVMRDFGSTALVCTPSYALYLAEAIAEKGIARSELALRTGLFGAEPWSENMRLEIESRLQISATDNYGLSEVMGPGVSMECACKAGMHVSEDHFIAEIIDPDTGEVLPPGRAGELVLTTLTKEAIPVIRYRTRDITSLVETPCACGRTFVRMTKPSGRTDDMLIIRGVNVFPSQIETVLMEMEETEPHYRLIVTREGALDDLEVQVEVNEKFFSDEMRVMRAIEDKIGGTIRSALGVTARVKLVEPRTIERSEGKAKRVQDLRKPL